MLISDMTLNLFTQSDKKHAPEFVSWTRSQFASRHAIAIYGSRMREFVKISTCTATIEAAPLICKPFQKIWHCLGVKTACTNVWHFPRLFGFGVMGTNYNPIAFCTNFQLHRHNSGRKTQPTGSATPQLRAGRNSWARVNWHPLIPFGKTFKT